ncbi:MAG: hypothetical protein ACPG19_03515 [Saprospiraceae bacterium]
MNVENIKKTREVFLDSFMNSLTYTKDNTESLYNKIYNGELKEQSILLSVEDVENSLKCFAEKLEAFKEVVKSHPLKDNTRLSKYNII